MAAKRKKSSIEVTLGELNESVQALQTIVRMDLGAREAFLFARVVRVIDAELGTYNETVQDLRNNHLIPKDEWKDPNTPEWKTETRSEQFLEEVKALNATVVKLPIEKLDISLLDGQKIRPAHLVNLFWLIDED